MPVKKSVRLVDHTIEVCKNLSEFSRGVINWSGSLNAMAEQFSLFIDDNTPELSENEWLVFYSSQNGHVPHPDPKVEAELLPWHISEGYNYDAQMTEFLGSKEAAISFIDRINSWSTSQRLAVIYKARAYWRVSPVDLDVSDEIDNE
ncbi:hypothetical protein OCF84_21325 (plasmid) [Shewanella xiamenensis]|uniref:Phage protein n=1 Tax=Shewanella xiamenensis TaxID=332186 RepID=A0ABT6UDN5_9GAMM|nr:hypothetical protein [Shewanella xiamenensis]MDI5832581.1 hypothetical protein [Shewanella xiamenensis]WHF57801.1 hypothetical protein OCF84_21325 [Shewanella xiamenensis]